MKGEWRVELGFGVLAVRSSSVRHARGGSGCQVSLRFSSLDLWVLSWILSRALSLDFRFFSSRHLEEKLGFLLWLSLRCGTMRSRRCMRTCGWLATGSRGARGACREHRLAVASFEDFSETLGSVCACARAFRQILSSALHRLRLGLRKAFEVGWNFSKICGMPSNAFVCILSMFSLLFM